MWANKQANSYTPSPVLFDGQLYVLTDSGVLTNFDATTGHVHYRERLPGPSNFKASPIGVNGRLYLASEEGRVFVVKMGSEFALLATNTPRGPDVHRHTAIVDGEVFLRSQAASTASARLANACWSPRYTSDTLNRYNDPSTTSRKGNRCPGFDRTHCFFWLWLL